MNAIERKASVEYGRRMAALRERTGTHVVNNGDGTQGVCDCGPANIYTGPRYAVINGVEYREALAVVK